VIRFEVVLDWFDRHLKKLPPPPSPDDVQVHEAAEPR